MCRAYHQKRGNHPIDKYTKGDLLPHGAMRQKLVQRLVSDFA